MTALEDAILRTILYADVFNFPLTLPEIHHFLIAPTPASLHTIEQTLMRSERLQRVLVCVDGYFMCAGREALAETRRARERASGALWPEAVRYARWMACIPFVRMVALTGALAVRNAVDGDDVDYMLVTREGRVWLARAFAVVVVRLVRLRGVQLCPNYVLAESALAQDRHDIFMAHEIAQMIPLYGQALYERMRCDNVWVVLHMPNAEHAFYRETDQGAHRVWRNVKRSAEWLLGGALGDRLEAWERERKLRRFAPRLSASGGHARLDAQQVKGHFEDRGLPALERYRARLLEFGLAE